MSIEERTDLIKDKALADSEESETTESMDPEPDTDTVNIPPFSEGAEMHNTAMPETSLSPDIQKHLNEKVIQQARYLRQQWNLIRERLDKINASKGKIKDSVYEKVSADYTNRMNEARRSFLDVKGDVDNELAKLRHEEADATRKVMEHEDTLEEAEFRHDLGEYTDSEFKEISQQEDAILNQARKEQDDLQGAISQYEEIFTGIDIEVKAPTPPPPQDVKPTPPPTPEAPKAEAAPPEEPPQEAAPTQAPPPNVGAPSPRAVDRKGERAAPQPEAPQAMLLLYENGQAVGQFKINTELTIGRSPNNEVVLKEPRVSRRHAVIRHTGNQYMIVDNNSSNGTYVNGHTVTEQVLRSGDKLQVGSFEMVFTL